eukprot:5356614-Pyramimonas_sp.AAC.1
MELLSSSSVCRGDKCRAAPAREIQLGSESVLSIHNPRESGSRVWYAGPRATSIAASTLVNRERVVGDATIHCDVMY